MDPITYFQVKINGIMPQLSGSQKKLVADWASDPHYDLSAEDQDPNMKLIEDFQKMIWHIESLQGDSDELNTYKQTFRFIKTFLSE